MICVDVPSKVILAGEHSVVYGQRAIVVSLSNPSLKIRCCKKVESNASSLNHELAERTFQFICNDLNLERSTMEINVESDVPLGRGLGSSGSFCVGAIVALSTLNLIDLTKDQIFEKAKNAEQLLHGGKSSGVDILNGGLCLYSIQEKCLNRMNVDAFSFRLVLVDTNVTRSTADLNKSIQIKQEPDVIDSIMNCLGIITNNFWTNLMYTRDYDLLTIHCRQCHYLLKALGLSHPRLDQGISIAEKYKVAAKLTGAGGGGCFLIIVTKDFNCSDLVNELSRENFTVFDNCRLSDVGYKIIEQ